MHKRHGELELVHNNLAIAIKVVVGFSTKGTPGYLDEAWPYIVLMPWLVRMSTKALQPKTSYILACGLAEFCNLVRLLLAEICNFLSLLLSLLGSLPFLTAMASLRNCMQV